jgi:hypothetical protein
LAEHQRQQDVEVKYEEQVIQREVKKRMFGSLMDKRRAEKSKAQHKAVQSKMVSGLLSDMECLQADMQAIKVHADLCHSKAEQLLLAKSLMDTTNIYPTPVATTTDQSLLLTNAWDLTPQGGLLQHATPGSRQRTVPGSRSNLWSRKLASRGSSASSLVPLVQANDAVLLPPETSFPSESYRTELKSRANTASAGSHGFFLNQFSMATTGSLPGSRRSVRSRHKLILN